jgi:hypothetical protein
MQKNATTRLWLARILIGVVLLVNLDCAFLFLLRPQDYMAGFGLSGLPGAGMLRGLGLLFVMWNVPYVFAAVHPIKHRTSLIAALIMQAIGFVGETMILVTGKYEYPIQTTIQRFIIFDSTGLIILFFIYLYTFDLWKNYKEKHNSK